ncbi:MAG TPA: hypothetical protein PLV92_16535, partial [Pirellulaceae bacterium]|nr:hypothetical protein [Pirellulaceae bacterium]
MGRKQKCRLGVEGLERRELMAGNVFASVDRGSLKLQGDAQANEIAITDLGGGKIQVTGANGTTLNRGAGPLTLNGVNLDVKVELGGGNDVVSWTGAAGHVLRQVTIETGDGNDTVSVDQVFAGLAKVSTGSGADVLNIMDVNATTAKFETGGGDDVANVGNPSVRTGVKVKAAQFTVETGDGADQIQVRDVSFDSPQTDLKSGAGDDTVNLSNVLANGQLKIETSGGKDTSAIAASTFNSLIVELGDGANDSLSITDSKTSKTKLSGGLGAGAEHGRVGQLDRGGG